MMKQKLPKNWIAVNSKSHPDRMYYFNVKTNETTWIQPKLEKTSNTSWEKAKNKEKHNDNKTKIPEQKPSEGKTSLKRSCKVDVDTPQMKAIKERLHQTAKDSFELQSARNVHVPGRSSDQQNNDIVFTQPQTRLIHEKRQENTKSTASTTSSKRNRKKNRRDKGGTNDNCEQNNIPTELKQRMASYNSSGSRQSKKKKQAPNPPLKKNIALKRMLKIREQLNNDDGNITENTKRVLKTSLSSCRDGVASHVTRDGPTHKNVRLKRLHNKAIKETSQRKNASLNLQTTETDGVKKSNKELVDNMTKDELIEQANREIFYEEMDWEPMKAEEIILEIEVARTELNKENYVHGVDSVLENTKGLIQPGGLESEDKSPLHIVIDTNVFLSNLEIVEEARNATDINPRPVIVIPWTVISELDYLKDKNKEELRVKAKKAIAFIHEQLKTKHPRVKGQTHEEAMRNKKKFCLECPDDEILQCCLQLRDLQKSVVLLSYDINLCNKALIHEINTLERNKRLEESITAVISNEELTLTDDIFEDTRTIMKNFLSTIVAKQMAAIYGPTEWKMYVIIKPPWSMIAALKCVLKHWIAAISELFERGAEDIFKQLVPVFERAPTGGRKLSDAEDTLEMCSVLVQKFNSKTDGELKTQTLDTIMELKKKCQKSISAINQERLFKGIGCVKDLEEQNSRATKAYTYFEHIYNHARDICGSACNVAGIAHSFPITAAGPSLSQTALQHVRPEICKKIIDLTTNLNKLLGQVNSCIKYETLVNLQQSVNTFLPEAFDVEPQDLYYCVKLKEDTLKYGLRQLQELSANFCALATRT